MAIRINDRFRINARIESQYLHSLATQEFKKEINIARQEQENKNKFLFYQVHIKNTDSSFNVHSLNDAKQLISGIQLMYDNALLKINANGNILEIVNFPDIVTQWGSIKDALLSDNEGEEAEQYLDKMGSKLQDKNTALEDICTFPVFGLLFFEVPPQNTAFNAASRKREIRLKNETLMIQEEWTLADIQPDNTNECVFNILGKQTDDNYDKDLNLLFYTGTVQFNYLHSYAVKASIELAFENKNKNYSKKIHYKLTRLWEKEKK